MLNPNELEALRLTGVYTAGHFDLWTLVGPAKATCRAHIMSVLRGHRVPQARAGITVLQSTLWALCPTMPNDCIAVRESHWEQWAKETIKGGING